MPRRPPAVARVLERVSRTVREHDMLEPGDLVLVAVSGGPDSVCLLYSLWHLRRLFKIRLAVFHFDHKLRADSAKDAAYVRRLAARLGVPFHVRVAKDAPMKGVSIEFWARYARDHANVAVASEVGSTRYADGHTMNDQAETILMALVLGWGLNGMGGISPVSARVVRPLLDVTRDEVEAFCRALGLHPRVDPTNADTRFLRNAIRLEVIPAIERATGRKVIETFARTAGLLAKDADTLWRQASEVAERLVELDDEDGFRLPVKPLLELPTPMGSRVVRRAFQMVDIGWDEDTINAVLDLAAGASRRRRDLLLGAKAVRERGHVHVSGPPMHRLKAQAREGAA